LAAAHSDSTFSLAAASGPISILTTIDSSIVEVDLIVAAGRLDRAYPSSATLDHAAFPGALISPLARLRMFADRPGAASRREARLPAREVLPRCEPPHFIAAVRSAQGTSAALAAPAHLAVADSTPSAAVVVHSTPPADSEAGATEAGIDKKANAPRHSTLFRVARDAMPAATLSRPEFFLCSVDYPQRNGGNHHHPEHDV
jgi:hypothetical protein